MGRFSLRVKPCHRILYKLSACFRPLLCRVFCDLVLLSARLKGFVIIGTLVCIYLLIRGLQIHVVFVPQITQFLLGDAIISSKTDPHNDSKKERKKYGKIKNILNNIKYLKQYSAMLF